MYILIFSLSISIEFFELVNIFWYSLCGIGAFLLATCSLLMLEIIVGLDPASLKKKRKTKQKTQTKRRKNSKIPKGDRIHLSSEIDYTLTKKNLVGQETREKKCTARLNTER